MADFEVPRQKMDFSSRYIHFSALLMGLSFFFRCLYYLGLNDIGSFGKGEVFLFLALPLLLCGTYIAMTAVIKINIPLIYCSLGVLICVMVILWSFSTASVARILLSILCYGGFAGLMICLLLGLLRDGRLAVAFLGLTVLLRILLFDRHGLSAGGWVKELSTLCALASLCLLPLTMQKVQKMDITEQ